MKKKIGRTWLAMVMVFALGVQVAAMNRVEIAVEPASVMYREVISLSDSKPDPGIGGEGDQADNWAPDEIEFWAEVEESIKQAQANSTVGIDAGDYDQMPASVMQALADAEYVTLSIRWNGGEEITLRSDEALYELSRISYQVYLLEYLAELDDELAFITEVSPNKQNPSIGNSGNGATEPDPAVEAGSDKQNPSMGGR